MRRLRAAACPGYLSSFPDDDIDGPGRMKDAGLRRLVQQAIEDEIASGALRPGDKLDERALAERFGLSRTPVREALNRLASIGLIETRPRHGSFVSLIPSTDLMALFELNGELESLCARMAARRMTEEERSLLVALAESGRDGLVDGEVSTYAEHNLAFHRAIGLGTHNGYLHAETDRIRIRAAPYRRNTLKLPGRLRASAEEHVEIAHAIANRDEDRAFSLMHRHTDIHRPEYRDFLFMLWQFREAPAGPGTAPVRRRRRRSGAV